MKVDAVSGIGFRNSNINFGEKQRVHGGAPASKPSRGADLAKVPVIVLLAMNPATLNSKIPTMPEADNPNKVVMLAPETKSAEKSTYVISPEVEETQQSGNDFLLPVDSETALKIQDFNYLGHKYKVVYASDSDTPENEINNIYFYKDNKKMNPGRLFGLIHHETVEGKTFEGALIKTPLYRDNKLKAIKESEIELPQYVSDFMYNVINNKTNFKNGLYLVTLYKSSSSLLSPSKITQKFD